MWSMWKDVILWTDSFEKHTLKRVMLLSSKRTNNYKINGKFPTKLVCPANGHYLQE